MRASASKVRCCLDGDGGLGTTNVATNEVDGSLSDRRRLRQHPAFQEDFPAVSPTSKRGSGHDSLPSWSQVFDFGGSQSSDNIILANDGTSSTVRFNNGNGASGSATRRCMAQGRLRRAPGFTSAPPSTQKWHRQAVQKWRSVWQYADGDWPCRRACRTSNFIGKDNWSNDAAFNGRIAHVRIWKRALSSDQVSDNYERAAHGHHGSCCLVASG